MDSSVIIEAAVRSYPRDVFPTFWAQLESLVGDNRVLAPRDVYLEVRKISDAAGDWVSSHREIFVATDLDLQNQVAEVLARYPGMIDVSGRANAADPFIVALARLRGLTVVTQERPGSAQSPKIPYVCKGLGLPCVNLIQFMRAEGWTF